MSKRAYTVGELAERCFCCSERLARCVLWPVVDDMWVLDENPDEVIGEEVLLRLLAIHPRRNKINKAVRAFLAQQRREDLEK